MIDHSVAGRGSTRHHRVDEPFLDLLESDFGISGFALRQSLAGAPPEPKKAAIAICSWAVRVSGGDVDEAGRALMAWARKHGKGKYDRRLVEEPAPTFGGHEPEGV